MTVIPSCPCTNKLLLSLNHILYLIIVYGSNFSKHPISVVITCWTINMNSQLLFLAMSTLALMQGTSLFVRGVVCCYGSQRYTPPTFLCTSLSSPYWSVWLARRSLLHIHRCKAAGSTKMRIHNLLWLLETPAAYLSIQCRKWPLLPHWIFISRIHHWLLGCFWTFSPGMVLTQSACHPCGPVLWCCRCSVWRPWSFICRPQSYLTF